MWLDPCRWIPLGGVVFSVGWCPPLDVVQTGEVVWCGLGLGVGSMRLCLDYMFLKGLLVWRWPQVGCGVL